MPFGETFISVVLNDPRIRSQFQTSRPFPGDNSEKHKGRVEVNKDGPIYLYAVLSFSYTMTGNTFVKNDR